MSPDIYNHVGRSVYTTELNSLVLSSDRMTRETNNPVSLIKSTKGKYHLTKNENHNKTQYGKYTDTWPQRFFFSLCFLVELIIVF